MNLRPPSAAGSTHTPASNAVAFQSPAMPNARTSLCTQSIHSFCFPPRPLLTAPCPQNFRTRFALATAAAHSDERPRPLKSCHAQGCLSALTSSYIESMVAGNHSLFWSLALCLDDAQQDPVVYGAEFGVVFLVNGPRIASMP